MIAEQYFDRLRRRADCPGKRLLLAVLENAVHCFQTNLFAYTTCRRHLFEEAEEWLLDEQTDASVTFDYVCKAYELDAEYLRAGLRSWRDHQHAVGQGQAAAPMGPQRVEDERDADQVAEGVGGVTGQLTGTG